MKVNVIADACVRIYCNIALEMLNGSESTHLLYSDIKFRSCDQCIAWMIQGMATSSVSNASRTFDCNNDRNLFRTFLIKHGMDVCGNG